eukprot:TRINITY_DN38092_c0_g1_i2.p1 TRINITY_DN38092_c0_g1~~TRINITY_DN38092_c0_g1_i2.p1  ORF type:complete len:268 (+),score=26.55 TRINITY_DN38092_c0_g1_i2:96-899(+)
MAFVPLGDAASTAQVAIMIASASFWCIFHALLVPNLVCRHFGAGEVSALSATQKRKVHLQVTSGVFAAFITCAAVLNLLFPNSAVKADRLYGYSDAVQATAGIATGFFFWNTIAELRDFELPVFVHHFACIFVFLFGQYPFLPQMGCISLTWESSTPPLCFRNVLRAMGRDKSALYSKTSNAFVVLFAISRILVGIPASVLWWKDMLELLGSDRLHSAAIVYFYLVANFLLNGLNIYWFTLITKGAIRKFVAGKAERSAAEERLLAG